MFFDTPLASLCFNLPTLLTYLQKQTPLPSSLPALSPQNGFLFLICAAMILLFGASGRYLGEGGFGGWEKGLRGNWVYIIKVRQIQIL